MTNNKGRAYQMLYLLRYAAASRIIKRARKPLVVSFKMTHDCNLSCIHCPFVKKNNRDTRMDFNTALDILEKLYREGARIVIFEGGEPLLWKDPSSGKDLSHLIERAKKKFFFTCITTNGTIQLKDYNPDIVFISLDGLQKTHDSIRGTGFDMIMSNIKKYHNQKKIIINTCINRLNFMEIPELIKFLEDKVYGITVQFFYPYSEVENLSLSTVQKKQVLEELIGLKKKGFSILDSFTCLKRMEENNWKCRDFLIASVEPDGHINQGCYLKNRVEDISCTDCGFAAHCEVSLAYDFNPEAIRAAKDIFWGKS
jgi:MoaA/NifB/PqqE/SkfB family radical SAM enzyme